MTLAAVARTTAAEPVTAVACAQLPPPVVCPPPTETIKTITAPVTREVCEPFLIATAAKAAPAAAITQTCNASADTIILFSYEKADVKQKYYEVIDTIGSFLKSYPGAKVTIEGHTSGMGNKVANMKLSQARAETIKSHIIFKYGIDGSRIMAKGYGQTKPVASNKTTNGRMQNRRIVAVFNCK